MQLHGITMLHRARLMRLDVSFVFSDAGQAASMYMS